MNWHDITHKSWTISNPLGPKDRGNNKNPFWTSKKSHEVRPAFSSISSHSSRHVTAEVFKGTVKSFNVARGFGFLTCPELKGTASGAPRVPAPLVETCGEMMKKSGKWWKMNEHDGIFDGQEFDQSWDVKYEMMLVRKEKHDGYGWFMVFGLYFLWGNKCCPSHHGCLCVALSTAQWIDLGYSFPWNNPNKLKLMDWFRIFIQEALFCCPSNTLQQWQWPSWHVPQTWFTADIARTPPWIPPQFE